MVVVVIGGGRSCCWWLWVCDWIWLGLFWVSGFCGGCGGGGGSLGVLATGLCMFLVMF